MAMAMLAITMAIATPYNNNIGNAAHIIIIMAAHVTTIIPIPVAIVIIIVIIIIIIIIIVISIIIIIIACNGGSAWQ